MEAISYMKEYDVAVIEEYLTILEDQRAERQAVRQPLYQALRVYKWILGYGGKQTFQYNKKAVATWNDIVKTVKRKFLIFDPSDVDPTKLIEMNQYAIELIKEKVLQ